MEAVEIKMIFKEEERTFKIRLLTVILAIILLVAGVFVYSYLISENSIETYIEKKKADQTIEHEIYDI